jgi:DNA-binding NarL/FixJ family response regulator
MEAIRMQTQADLPRRHTDARLRVGLLACDPLRSLGFQALFDGHQVIAIVPVSDAAPLDQLDVDLMLVAAQSKDQVFEAIRSLRAARPEIPLLIMAAPQEPEFIQRVLRVGAHGYLTVTAAREEIEEAIAQIYDGQTWTPRLTSTSSATANHFAAPSPAELYTGRELQVLDLLHTGQSNREIASALQIEERTVKSHVARLLKKMGVKNRTALIMQAIGQNLVGHGAVR